MYTHAPLKFHGTLTELFPGQQIVLLYSDPVENSINPNFGVYMGYWSSMEYQECQCKRNGGSTDGGVPKRSKVRSTTGPFNKHQQIKGRHDSKVDPFYPRHHILTHFALMI
jgi:hypothetical protein